jgi:hypothetical protein
MEKEDFWKQVKEYYTYKKKNLINFIDPTYFDCDKSILNTYKNFTYDELRNAYKKFEMDSMTCSQSEEKYYLEILLDQFEPLKPPYTKSEIDEMMKTVDCNKIGIPEDLFEYLTKVSREILVFNERTKIINMNKLSKFQEHFVPIKNKHANNCDCFDTIRDSCPSLEICPKLPEEEKKKFREDIENQKKQRGDIAEINGIYLGSNDGSYGGGKILACNKNSVFGKIFKSSDDSYAQYNDVYDEYVKSLKLLIKIKMEREKNGNYDYESDCYSGNIYSDGSSDEEEEI